ncbi:potassium-transporting ATPase subunit C [Periweissella fabaria]|uniref:Potassium-transporting ATPase KdpC subunit n=1 Tax=Periweissella fabaria TaxID=546157 RepID=A0ABN8BL88_9LACO|nr:potassium-transporting ATPase subunit C [Periweissella fabaria]MCM0596645.1 potassium-transporting ATPase subunit C [Periweissella fabaria]CAH0416430.1 Potassium-transporting ATPase KdpC subunit [Periweissella fabaria]
MKVLFKQAAILIGCLIIGTLVYTGITTVVAQTVFHQSANGSLIYQNNHVTGSKLIATDTVNPKLFVGRVNVASNLAPNSRTEKAAVAKRVAQLRALDPTNKQPIPVDLVTGSASGSDPYISVAAAKYQITRIAHANNLSTAQVQTIIKDATTSRLSNLLGTPAVNIVTANLALQASVK